MDDSWTSSVDTRLRPSLRLDVTYGDREVAFTIDEPDPDIAAQALATFERFAGLLLTGGAA